MGKTSGNFTIRNIAAVIGLSLAVAACQTGTPDEVLNVDDAITPEDLRAYCPRPTLLEGTAILREYTEGNDGNPEEVVYQASITDVTRSCRYRNGQLFMTVAAAGRVLNGPKGTGGQLNLPVRVAVQQLGTVPYSTLGRLDVTVIPGAGATQFIYKDEQIVLPEPTERNLVVLVGFDEGPYNTP